MKKINKYILLVLSILLLTGCTNYKEIIDEQTNKVEDKLNIISNISETKIKESFIYIKDNIDKINKKDIYTEIAFNNKYIELLTKSNQNNKLYKLTEIVNTALENKDKKSIKEVKDYIEKIENEIDDLANDAYTYYYHNNVVDKKIEEFKNQAIADSNDKNMVTIKQIKTSLEYIENHIDNPYENEEVLEKIIYHSLFLSNLSENKNDKIVTIANNTLTYIKTMNSNVKHNVTLSIATVNDNDCSKLVG